jgi:hypothetical protein
MTTSSPSLSKTAVSQSLIVMPIKLNYIGARLCYLPSNSPHYNPATQALHALKISLQDQDDDVCEEFTLSLIELAVLSINAHDARSWIFDSGYT